MIVNGIEDHSSKVTVKEGSAEKYVRITKETTIEVFKNSTFNELGEFLTFFTTSYTYLKEWELSIHLKANCTGEKKGVVEMLMFVNYDNWKSNYSPLALKQAIYRNVDMKSNIEVIAKDNNIIDSDFFLTLQFYPPQILSEINSAFKFAVQEFETLWDEVQEKLSQKNKSFTFSVPKEMTIALKQYLVYFPEYVEIAKGKKISFEVKTTNAGLYVQLGDDSNIEGVNDYFNEYLNFVKSNIDILNIKFELEISETKKEIFIIGLKQQVHHLKQQMELKNFEIKVLEREVDRYYNLLSVQSAKTLSPIYITNSVNSENNININIEFKQEISKLQSDILTLKSLLTPDVPEVIKKEIELIDHELLESSNNSAQVNKTPFTRIKRLFEQLTDDNSQFSKAVKKSKKLKNSLQKVGKAYNKVAEWLALPVIPKALLEI